MVTTSQKQAAAREQQIQANYAENRELAELMGLIDVGDKIDAETLAEMVEALYGDIV